MSSMKYRAITNDVDYLTVELKIKNILKYSFSNIEKNLNRIKYIYLFI